MNALRSALVFAWMVVSIIPMGLALLLTSPFVGSASPLALVRRTLAARGDRRGTLGGRRGLPGPGCRAPAGSRGHASRDPRLKAPVDLGDLFLPEHDAASACPMCSRRNSCAFRFLAGVWRAGNGAHRSQQTLRGMDAGRHAGRAADGSWQVDHHVSRGHAQRTWCGQGVYKTGATRLGIATSATLIPIAVASGRCWPRRSFWFIPGRIDVSIGAPIPPEGRAADELMREVEGWIEAEMRRIDPDA
jgi:1-acyl-sn-glycerol-3-phosphate acyltransferase